MKVAACQLAQRNPPPEEYLEAAHLLQLILISEMATAAGTRHTCRVQEIQFAHSLVCL